jgi:hypothetical protein
MGRRKGSKNVVARQLKDHTGTIVGKLTAIAFSHKEGKNPIWAFKCSCGNTKAMRVYNVIGGRVKSCGCLESKRNTTHGQSSKRGGTYISWEQMRQRAKSGTAINAKDYKGRGITVCDEWDRFETFLNDMGERPANTSLDRIDNDKGYTKENCRWATKTQQARNRRNTITITINGVLKTLSEWCEIYKQEDSLVRARLRIGWDVVKALTIPKIYHYTREK